MKNETTHTLPSGTILEERYRIERVIGEGGFGITYEAVNEKLEMTVAIKEFYCRDYISRDVEVSNDIKITAAMGENFERAKKRFLQEAKILSGFNDESAIVKVLDYFEENGTAYIVMNYLNGISLEQYLQQNGVMEWREVLEKFRPLMETLERVHNRGVLHRDISPSNIMVLGNGSLCLLDFGSAREHFIEEGENTTTIFSKQGYTPIEQYAQNKQLGAWTDIYALTAVLYECLTGTHPPDSVQRAIYDEYETLQEKNIKAPPQMDALFKKGLAIHVEKRYSNMRELLNAIDDLLAEKKSKKVKWLCLTVICVIFVCAAGSLWYVHNNWEQIYFNFEETETFRFARDENTTIAEFDRDFQRIEERIKILAGTKPYIWEKETDEFYGVLPLACFGREDPREIIRDLIARPCKWTICDVELDEYIEHIGFKDGQKRELEISLSEKTPKDKQDSLKELCKDGAELSVDYGYINHLSLEGQMHTPLKFTWDLQKKWENEKMRELFVHNISHHALSVTLDVHAQIQVAWETKEAGKFYGKKQCAIEDLSDDTVTLEYWEPYEDDRTEGAVADFEREIKGRLDLLDIPYAAGQERNHSRRFVLCVNQQDYNEDLFWLIFRNKGDITIEDDWGAIMVSSPSVSLIEQGEVSALNDSLVINISKESESTMEYARKCVEDMEKQDIRNYYLVVDGIRILKGTRGEDSSHAEQMKRGQFTFQSVCMANEQLGGDNEKIIRLLNAIIKSDYETNKGGDLFSYQFSDSTNAVATDAGKKNTKYSFSVAREEQIVKKIKALSSDYGVKNITNYETGGKELSVMLSEQIYAESLLDKEIAISQIYRIMEECRLEEEALWNKILIGVKSRYEEGNYAARLCFYRGAFEKKRKKAYMISAIAYEKEEAKWLKEIHDKMKVDSRFQGYDMEYKDYSDYFLY